MENGEVDVTLLLDGRLDAGPYRPNLQVPLTLPSDVTTTLVLGTQHELPNFGLGSRQRSRTACRGGRPWPPADKPTTLNREHPARQPRQERLGRRPTLTNFVYPAGDHGGPPRHAIGKVSSWPRQSHFHGTGVAKPASSWFGRPKRGAGDRGSLLMCPVSNRPSRERTIDRQTARATTSLSY